MARKKDPGQGSYPGSVEQPPGAGPAFPPGSWKPQPAIGPASTSPPARPGVPDGQYATSNTAQSVGTERVPLAGNLPVAPAGGASPIGSGPAYRRNTEESGARLTFSPSMKLGDPTGFSVPTMANARVVSSGRGRSAKTFWQGFSDTGSGFAPPAPGAPTGPAMRG